MQISSDEKYNIYIVCRNIIMNVNELAICRVMYKLYMEKGIRKAISDSSVNWCWRVFDYQNVITVFRPSNNNETGPNL